MTNFIEKHLCTPYMVTTLLCNFFLNLLSNNGNFNLLMFTITTTITTSWYFAGYFISKRLETKKDKAKKKKEDKLYKF